MALNRNDLLSDAIADLYRASYYLAKESKSTAMLFLQKSKSRLGRELNLDVNKIVKRETFKTSSDYSFWAEKILDEYKRLKRQNNLGKDQM